MSYYAVHKGYMPGIYTTWDSCQQQINGFSKAIFKKFTNEKEAVYFAKHGIPYVEPNETIGIRIYTDGSVIPINEEPSAGCGIWIPEENIKIKCKPPGKQTISRAEIFAIITAIQQCNINDIINIYTDSQHCINIITSNQKFTKNRDLVDELLELNDRYRLNIFHVKAHYVDPDNKIADKLAREAAKNNI